MGVLPRLAANGEPAAVSSCQHVASEVIGQNNFGRQPRLWAKAKVRQVLGCRRAILPDPDPRLQTSSGLKDSRTGGAGIGAGGRRRTGRRAAFDRPVPVKSHMETVQRRGKTPETQDLLPNYSLFPGGELEHKVIRQATIAQETRYFGRGTDDRRSQPGPSDTRCVGIVCLGFGQSGSAAVCVKHAGRREPHGGGIELNVWSFTPGDLRKALRSRQDQPPILNWAGRLVDASRRHQRLRSVAKNQRATR